MSEETRVLDRGEPDDWVRLSAHPRAKRSIARSKAIGGLLGFVIGWYVASKAGLPAWDTGVRALIGGVAGYVLIWLAAVQLWKQMILAEYRAADKARKQRIADHNARMEQLHAERAEAMKAAREALS